MCCQTSSKLPPPPPGKTGWPWIEETVQLPDAAFAGLPWPRVSIVTPSYNQVQFIEETIRSVLSQGYPNLEYIIMDGGSTDGSEDIIRKYQDHLAFWVSELDDGQSDAINRGFAKATGDILAWLNSDDTYEPGAICAVAETFVRNPNTHLVYGEGWYIDPTSTRIRPCKFVKSTFPDVYIYNKDPILQQAAFWSRDLWEQVGSLDESLYWVFDWEWFIRAHQIATFRYIPWFLANYRVHPGAKTRTKGVKRRIEQARITRKYGGWWHPNYLVQQTRIQSYRVESSTSRWPRWISAPMRFLAALPPRLSEFIFYGRYMT